MRHDLPPELRLGMPDIDAAHLKLFQTADRLLEAVEDGRGAEEIRATFEFLDTYVVEHFDREESLMRELDYPGLAEHRQHHQTFLEDERWLKAIFEQEGPNPTLAKDVRDRVLEWLAAHLLSVDRKLIAFVRARAG